MRRLHQAIVTVAVGLLMFGGLVLFNAAAHAQFPRDSTSGVAARAAQPPPPAPARKLKLRGVAPHQAQPARPRNPALVLYDQYDNLGINAISSQNFEPALDPFDAQAADDFVVPAGQAWGITGMEVAGVYFNCEACGTPAAASLNVVFYQNVVSGTYSVPGTVVASRPNLAYTASPNPGDFVITISPMVSLPAGTFWVSVQANMDFASDGQWGWTNRTVQANDGAAWRNPGGGWKTSCTDWDQQGFCVGDSSEPDQVFRLTGNLLGQPPTHTPTATNTPVTATITPTPTNTGTPPTATPEPMETDTPVVGTQTPQPDETETPVVGFTPTPEPNETETPVVGFTPSPDPNETETPVVGTPGPTDTPQPDETETPVVGFTPTPEPNETQTPVVGTQTPEPQETGLPESTPGPNETQTSTSSVFLVGHVTWQSRPAQPSALNQLPITLILRRGTAAPVSYHLVTDASGFFTASVKKLPPGVYTWWVKGSRWLATKGSVTLTGAPRTQQEMGMQRAGDADNDNLANNTDFVLLRANFGLMCGNPRYDARADINGDCRVDSTDFIPLRANFGQGGSPAP